MALIVTGEAFDHPMPKQRSTTPKRLPWDTWTAEHSLGLPDPGPPLLAIYWPGQRVGWETWDQATADKLTLAITQAMHARTDQPARETPVPAPEWTQEIIEWP